MGLKHSSDGSGPLYPVSGVRLSGSVAGIKKSGAPDLGLLALAPGTVTGAVFTRNVFAAAPVWLARRNLGVSQPRYLLVNSGNANAGTGWRGRQDAEKTCTAVAKQAGCLPDQVLPFSTGVIGEPLPAEKIIAALPGAYSRLDGEGWEDFARAILTTDTFIKTCSEQVTIDGSPVTITGVSKGSGMIRPDMATMLAFVATDAGLPANILDQLLRESTEQSFNRIVVDGDMSTNDAYVLSATGATGVRIDPRHASWRPFREALLRVVETLAKAIVRDGEGATKLVTIEVQNGRDEEECVRVARAIACSPLVKTAFFASDPNWGRILAAVGYAGVEDLDGEQVSIFLDDCCIVRDGARAPDYEEHRGAAVMGKAEFCLRVHLGRGSAAVRLYTCDLSYDYVRINAEYRS